MQRGGMGGVSRSDGVVGVINRQFMAAPTLPPLRGKEWYGLPLILRHQMCQIGDGFITNHEKGE